jgi:hypothetical protein
VLRTTGFSATARMLLVVTRGSVATDSKTNNGEKPMSKVSHAITVILLGLLLAACGSDSTQDGCEARSGSYLYRYDERSGNCGPLAEEVLVLDSAPDPVELGCEVRTGYPIDLEACGVDVDLTCPEPGIGDAATSTWRGSVNWSANADRGSGVMKLVIQDGDRILCQSSYDVTVSRL